jgi:hypothetical protein
MLDGENNSTFFLFEVPKIYFCSDCSYYRGPVPPLPKNETTHMITHSRGKGFLILNLEEISLMSSHIDIYTL